MVAPATTKMRTTIAATLDAITRTLGGTEEVYDGQRAGVNMLFGLAFAHGQPGKKSIGRDRQQTQLSPSMLILPSFLEHLFPGFEMLPGKLSLMTAILLFLFVVMTTLCVQLALMRVR